MIETLAQIVGDSRKGSFTAGIVLWDDTCVVAAPIVRYMKGWDRQKIRSYCGQRKWTVSVVHEIKRERP
jgi:hypothetical protein